MNTRSEYENRVFIIRSQKLKLAKMHISFIIANLLFMMLLLFDLIMNKVICSLQPALLPLQTLAAQIAFLVFFLFGLFLLISFVPYTTCTLHRLTSRQPALSITDQGLYFKNLPVVGNIFLGWSELASISVGPQVVLLHNTHTFYTASGHLCFGLKDQAQFLSRFHPLQRFLIIGFCSLLTATLIHMPPGIAQSL